MYSVESAYSIIVTWNAIHPKSGLDVTYLLFQGRSNCGDVADLL